MAVFYWANWNDFQLNTIPYLQISSIDTYKVGSRNLSIFPIARQNSNKTSAAFYQGRKINIGVYITAPNRDLLDKTIDTLFSYISTIEGTLAIPQSGTTRLYTATYSSMQVTALKGGFMDFTLTFECSDSYGYDAKYTQIDSRTGLTSGNMSTAYTQGGTAETQVPHFEIKYTGSSANTGSVTIGNQNTGQAIVVAATFSQYDILVVDSQKKIVQINGVDVAFTGAFPEFAIGPATFYYLDTFTSRTFNQLVYVYNRYN